MLPVLTNLIGKLSRGSVGRRGRRRLVLVVRMRPLLEVAIVVMLSAAITRRNQIKASLKLIYYYSLTNEK